MQPNLARAIALIAGILMSALSFAATAAEGVSLRTELVMMEEHGCPWCIRWNEEIGVIYHKTPEGRRAPLRRVDIHGAIPDDLSFLKRANFSPTFILVDGGREVGRIRGYPGDEFFWFRLQELLKKLPPEVEEMKAEVSK